MSPFPPVNPSTSQVDDRLNVNVSVTHAISVPCGDRWRIYHRLQELRIPCWCPEDGSLRIEVQNSMDALLLRSVMQQFVASRQEMVNWLERCWDMD